jgi:rRNA-processing protein FCF1
VDGGLDPRDRINPVQVEALWRIRETRKPPLTPEEQQLLAALRVAIGRQQPGVDPGDWSADDRSGSSTATRRERGTVTASRESDEAMPTRTPPPTYADRISSDLETLRASFHALLEGSEIRNIDPNRGGSDVVFLGAAKWGWAPSDIALEAARMTLLPSIETLRIRLTLLFPHPTPRLRKQHEDAFKLLDAWARRETRDHSVPSTLEKAHAELDETIDGLAKFTQLLTADEYPVRLMPDTNALVDNPDLTVYADQLGKRYRVHLSPTVLGELDELKRSGRNQELREAAGATVKRLKGLRTNGDVLGGVRVAGDISCVFEHTEPRSEALPDWLDLTVPDDRVAASAILLQSAHPSASLYVATSDINLQNKLSALGLPWVEGPERQP